MSDLSNLTITLIPCAFRVPLCGDIFLSKTGKLMRCKAKNYSNRAKKRFIVYSNYEPTQAKIVHSLNEPAEALFSGRNINYIRGTE